MVKTKDNKRSYSINLNIGSEEFILTIICEGSKIIFLCKDKTEYLSFYDYSIDFTFEAIKKLGRSFLICDNINEVYDLLKNLCDGVKIDINKKNDNTTHVFVSGGNNEKEKMESKIELILIKEGILKLKLNIPLLNGKKEIIDIQFNAKERNIINSFIKLKSKYLGIKTIMHENKWTSDGETCKKIKKEIEE